MSPKTFTIEVLANLPEDATFEECVDEARLAHALWESLQAAERGEVVPHEEVFARLQARFAAAAQVASDG